MIRSVLFCVLLCIPSVASAELVLMNAGDSISSTNGHRIELQRLLDQAGIAYNFVGDVNVPRAGNDINHQAFSGNSLKDVLHGRTYRDEWQAGLIDAIPAHNPTHILLLGGYNNITKEAVGSGLPRIKGYFTDIADHVRDNSNATLFVSNITDLNPELWERRQNVLDYNAWLATEVQNRRLAGDKIQLVDNFSDITYDDLNSDGLHISASGHVKVGANWFEAVSTPEPSSMMMFAFAVSCTARRRRP
ncbi:MAG: PEP-CTERM sorting domain-containing protein [Mariniblastus sp.]